VKKLIQLRSQTGGIALLLAAALLAPAALAQDSTSSIRGIVRDDNGPIPLATVAAVDASSGFRLETTAGEDGRFNLAGLKPGTYEVTVASEAYQPQTETVQILLGQDVQAEFVLGLSEVFLDEVTVIGDATPLLIDTRGSEVSTNITTKQIEQLPQSSRNFLGFAALAPGVRFTDNQDDAGQKFRSGGADSRQVNVFIDGLSYKNDVLPGGAFMQENSRGNPFPQNAVQEFRVLTQNYKAEFEKAAAAVITAVTKSGGNEYHGEVFYFTQDKDMVTQDDFAKATQLMSNVSAVSTKVRQEKAEALRRYTAAMIKTSRFYSENKEQWVTDMAKLRPDIATVDLQALWDQFRTSWSVNGFMNPALYQKTSDYLYSTEDFADVPRIELNAWVDPSLVDAVLKELGVHPGWDEPGRPI